MRIYFLITFQFLINFRILSQNPASINYTTNDGLVSNTTYRLIRDSRGYIWICSDEGISQFNGLKFRNFDVSNGLDGYDIFNCTEDSLGNIWVASYRPSLYIITPQNEVFPYSFNDTILKYTSRNRVISSLYVNSEFTVTIGFQYDGVLRITRHGVVLPIQLHEGKVVMTDGINPVNYSYGDNSKFDYTGSLASPMITIQYRDTSYKFFSNEKFPISFKSPSLYSCQLTNQSLLISNNNHLYNFKYNQIKKEYFNDIIDCIAKGRNGELFIGFIGNGFLYYPQFEINNDTSIRYFKELSITDILIEPSGAIFFSTTANGIFYVPNLNVIQFNKLLGIKVSQIALVGRDAFVGFYNGSVYRINIDNLNNSEILMGIEDTRLDIPVYFGYDSSSKKIILENSNLDSIIIYYPSLFQLIDFNKTIGYSKTFLSSSDGLWIGTQARIHKFEKNQLTYTSDSSTYTKEVTINCNVICKGMNQYWIGSKEGLFSINRNNKKVKINSINGEINDLIFVSPNLFIGSKDDGLLLMNHEDIKVIDGSIGNVKSLTTNDTSLWYSYDGGIKSLILNDLTLKGRLNLEVPLNKIQKIKYSYGKLVIGTSYGLYVAGLGNIKDYSSNPKLSILSIYINDEWISSRTKLNLPYNSFINVNVDLICFEYQKNLNCSYRLSTREEWKNFQYPMLHFNSLMPNDYELQMLASNTISKSRSRIKKFEFTIKPPFWQNKLFISISLICVGVIVIILHQLKLKVQRQRIITEFEHEKERNLLELRAFYSQINPHFTFNALNSLQGLILGNDLNSSLYYINKFSRYLRKILDNSKESFVRLEEEIDLVTRYFEMENLRYRSKVKYKILTSKSLSKEQVFIPSMLIQPIIENIFKHAFKQPYSIDDAKVKVEFIDRSEIIEVSITDNGPGYSKSIQDTNDSKRLHGLDLVKNRLKIINRSSSNLNVFSILDYKVDGIIKGTEVRMVLPKIIDNAN